MKERRVEPIIYTALGDSTGVGVGAKNGGYVAHLFNRIAREYPNATLKNFCMSGATTADVLNSQLRPAIASNPTLVTIGIGINDIGRGVTVEKFASNYEEIVSQLKSRTRASIVITNLPDVSLAPAVPLYLRDSVYNLVVLFNQKIADIAKRYELFSIDVYEATHNKLASTPGIFSADSFHPSDLGYEKWAEAMWATVDKAINAKLRAQ